MRYFRQILILVPGLILCTGFVSGCGRSSENTTTAPPTSSVSEADAAARQKEVEESAKNYDPRKSGPKPTGNSSPDNL